MVLEKLLFLVYNVSIEKWPLSILPHQYNQALITYFSSWQQASQTKNFLPIFFINLNFGCNSITASCI
jgi:hypothetical protein